MILFLNTYLTADIPWITYDRGDLPPANKVDVLKYQLASYSLLPWDEVHLNIELDPSFADRDGELQDWIVNHYSDTLYFNLPRCTNIGAWRERLSWVLEGKDPRQPVWFACNHDHPFIAPDLSLVSKIKDLFYSNEDEDKAMIYSHWSEFLREAAVWGWRPELDGFISYQAPCPNTHSIQVVSANLLKKWFNDSNVAPDLYLPRSDWWYGNDAMNGQPMLQSPHYRTYVPMQEMCRHFDGYTHIKVNGMALAVPSHMGIAFKEAPTVEERNRIVRSAFEAYGGPECPREFLL